MKDQVVMSKVNGAIAVAVPLYRWQQEEELTTLAGYSVFIAKDKPIAYVIDCGDHGCSLANADFVNKHLEFLGDL